MRLVPRFTAFTLLAISAVAIAQTPAASGDVAAKAQVCAECHGENGNSTDPQYPVLAGQNARYIYLQLKDFKEGRRHDPQMDPMAAPLSRDDMLALADHFAKQKPAPAGFKADPAKVAAGKKKSDEVLCPMCHLGEFAGHRVSHEGCQGSRRFTSNDCAISGHCTTQHREHVGPHDPGIRLPCRTRLSADV